MLPAGMPSTMYSGEAWLMEPTPRTMTVELAPGAPECWVTWTPEVMPWSMLSTRFWDCTFRSSAVTEEMEAVTTDFFWTP